MKFFFNCLSLIKNEIKEFIIKPFLLLNKKINITLLWVTKDLNDILISFIPLLVYIDFLSKTHFDNFIYFIILILFISVPLFFISSLVIEKYKGEFIKQTFIIIVTVLTIFISINLSLQILEKNTNNNIKQSILEYRVK